MTYGYIRVSTETQTVENQKIVITEWATKYNRKISRWIAETKSGTIAPQKRKLGDLVQNSKKGDTIIITELSRLGRSMIMIMNVLQVLLDKGVAVIAIKENYELGDNLQSKVLAFAFGIAAEIERQLISERTKAGLKRARKAGKRIGRVKGQKNIKYKLTGRERAIKIALNKGFSIRFLSKKYHVTWSTMRNFINQNNLRKKKKKKE